MGFRRSRQNETIPCRKTSYESLATTKNGDTFGVKDEEDTYWQVARQFTLPRTMHTHLDESPKHPSLENVNDPEVKTLTGTVGEVEVIFSEATEFLRGIEPKSLSTLTPEISPQKITTKPIEYGEGLKTKNPKEAAQIMAPTNDGNTQEIEELLKDYG